MSRLREEHEQFLRLLNRLHRSNHNSLSWSAVAMLEGLGNDKVVRLMSRAKELACGEVTQVRNGRIELTDHGRLFRDWLEDLRSLQRSQVERIEELRVAIRPGVDPAILAIAIGMFTRSFGHIALRVEIQPEGMQEAVDSNHFAFGVTWTDDGAAGSCERIEPAIPATVQIPRQHRLFGAAGPIDADHFAPTDIVFMAPGMESCFSELLHRVLPANRIEVGCPETLRRLVADGHGLAVDFAHPSQSQVQEVAHVLASGVEPISLGFALPRKRDVTDEPATMFLMQAIRNAVRDAALPSIPSLESLEEHNDALPEIPPLVEPSLT
jgi:DNA-binding transcriptional LysR family regulator